MEGAWVPDVDTHTLGLTLVCVRHHSHSLPVFASVSVLYKSWQGLAYLLSVAHWL